MQKLSVALIGYGYWGRKLFKTLQKTQLVKIVAVCDKHQNVTKGVQLLNSEVQLVTNNYRRIVSKKDVNAVVIATPPETHYKIAKASLMSGKHVLLEKPMTTNKSHALELCKLANKKKLILMVDHTYLYAPEIRVAKQIIDDGILGKVSLIETTRVGPGQYKYDSDVIWDFAPHDISILYYLLGRPIKSSAIKSFVINRGRVDISNLYIKFAKGYEAYLHLSWISPIKVRKMVVVGKENTLLIDGDAKKGKIFMYPSKNFFRGDHQTNPPVQWLKNLRSLSGLPYSEPLKNVCHEFVQCIVKHTQPLSDGYLGFNVVNIIEAISQVKSRPGKYEQ